MSRARLVVIAMVAMASIGGFLGCQDTSVPSNEPNAAKSRMLRTVESMYTPQMYNPKGQGSIAAADNTGKEKSAWEKLADIAGVLFDDVVGFGIGAAAGAASGAVLESANPDKSGDANYIGAVVGGTLKAVEQSARSAAKVDWGSGGGKSGDGTGGGTPAGGSGSSEGGSSSEGGTGTGGGIVVRRPSIHPYSSTTKPTSIDSIGWLHNEGVIYLLRNLTSGTNEDYRTTLVTWAKNVAQLDPMFIDQVAGKLFDGSSPRPEVAFAFENYPDVVRNEGRIVEGNYVDSMHSEITYLANSGYGLNAVLALIRGYRDNVGSLGLSAARRTVLEGELTIYMYSLALWSENL
ncbi:MAG: hypothetical protein FGM24_05285 [Candidatus Kapabacteria bacterium]|nr:hypothetical protein [Candidatus Kapabacteria bacterium]